MMRDVNCRDIHNSVNDYFSKVSIEILTILMLEYYYRNLRTRGYVEFLFRTWGKITVFHWDGKIEDSHKPGAANGIRV